MTRKHGRCPCGAILINGRLFRSHCSPVCRRDWPDVRASEWVKGMRPRDIPRHSKGGRVDPWRPAWGDPADGDFQP